MVFFSYLDREERQAVAVDGQRLLLFRAYSIIKVKESPPGDEPKKLDLTAGNQSLKCASNIETFAKRIKLHQIILYLRQKHIRFC